MGRLGVTSAVLLLLLCCLILAILGFALNGTGKRKKEVVVVNKEEEEEDYDSAALTGEGGNRVECCGKLWLEGTASELEFDLSLMGEYSLWENGTELIYKGVNGRKDSTAFPVYSHDLIGRYGGKKSLLYFFFKEDTGSNETECPKGCWMIGLTDPTPGSYWFGKKYFRVKDYFGQCPPSQRENTVFLNSQGDMEINMTLSCQQE